MGIYPLNAAANAVGFLSIGLQLPGGIGPHDDVLTCATEIRKSLEGLKDPRLVENIATDFARAQSHSAWNKSSQGFSKEGCLIVNITRRWVSGCLGTDCG